MKNIFLIAAVLSCLTSAAQIKKVSLQASGLTCSMCSNSILKSLKTVDFVDKVDANIKTSTFDIVFKPGKNIDFDQLKNKVEDAGFSVADFRIVMQFDPLLLNKDSHITSAGITFHFLNTINQTFQGEQVIRIIDKGFVSAKEYKKNSKLTALECYKTGIAEPCCIQYGIKKGTRIFHVTI